MKNFYINNGYKKVSIRYEKNKWNLYKPGINKMFVVFDERNKDILKHAVQKGLLRDDLAQFKHMEKKIVLDIQADFNSLEWFFNFYTITVIDFTKFEDNYPKAWENPIEKKNIKSSTYLKENIESLIKKYQ